LLFAVVSLLFFAARTAATNFYRPFLLVANTVYLLLRYFRYGWEVPSFWGSVGIFSLWALEYFAYIGILDNAVNRSVGDKGLVGGSSLDLLGLVVLVQFGTILFSPKFYWLLAVLPPWGAWTLYKLFAGGNGLFGGTPGNDSQKSSQIDNRAEGVDDDKRAERRQKRAEKRRQKWS